MSSGDSQFEIIRAYIASANSITRLSTGGLVLPMALKSDVFNVFDKSGGLSPRVLVLISVSWALFLIAIGAGALYEYAAVKSLEYDAEPLDTYVPGPLHRLVVTDGPGVAYGVMIGSFYLGAVCVVLYSAIALFTTE